jgi:hypothetical protein
MSEKISCNTNLQICSLGVLLGLYKNDNTKVRKPELQENSQQEKITLGGQKQGDHRLEVPGGGGTGNGQGGNKADVHIDCLANCKVAKLKINGT